MDGTVLEIVYSVVGTIIGVIVPLIFVEFQKRTGLKVDARLQESFQLAVSNAAKALIQKYGSIPAGVRLTSEQEKFAVTYVANGAPEALEHFGNPSDETILTKVLPHLLDNQL